MARFKAAKSQLAPLRIQLATSTTSSIEIVGVCAYGEGTTGAGSRPVLSRPSTPGKGTGTALPLDGHSVSTTTVITKFSSAPSYPSVDVGAFALPMRVEWRMRPNNGIIIPPSDYALLYAFSSGAYKWSGEIEWEEK